MPQSPSDYILEAKGLAKAYSMGHGTVHALRSVDLQIKKGECVAIMGPSGSGKSTLMHLLGCLDRPSQGHYILHGQDVSQLDDKALSLIRAIHIGFVFQSFNLIPQLSVFENVEVPFMYRHEPVPNSEKMVNNAIERVGLAHRAFHLPTELSGGEMQRVAIARALAIDPWLILADEPTGNLDSNTGKTILKLFQELNRQGVTILLVTHDEHVAKHCPRVIRMKDGGIVADQTWEAVQA